VTRIFTDERVGKSAELSDSGFEFGQQHHDKPQTGNTATRAPFLSAVVCPLVARELPLALRNFDLWTEKGIDASPVDPSRRPRLIYSFNCAETPSFRDALREAYDRHPLVRESFAGIDVRFCNLPPEKDVYIRKPTERILPFGYKAGPNWQFYETLNSLKAEAKFIFLMELDCEPIESNWLQELERVCAQNEGAWIIGSNYRGVSPLQWNVARHINGNALYNVGDSAFWRFLDDILWPWMHQYIRDRDPTLAYDCALETFLNREEMEDPGNYDWIISRDALPHFRVCNAIVNIAGTAEQVGDYLWTKEDVTARYPGAVIVHGPLTRSSEHFRDRLALGIPKANGSFVATDNHLECCGTVNGAQMSRTLWLLGRPFAPGMTLSFHLTVLCPSKQGVRIGLCDQNARFIDTIKWVREEGDGPAHRVTLNHAFADRHAYLRIILQPISRANKAAEIQCDFGSLEVTSSGARIAAAERVFIDSLSSISTDTGLLSVPETWQEEDTPIQAEPAPCVNEITTYVGHEPVTITTVRLDEYYFDDSYSRLDISLLLVRYGEEIWPQIKFKFGFTAIGRELEFRQGTGWPAVFTHWPSKEKDKHGLVFKLRDDEKLLSNVEFWQDARDLKLLALISTLLPEIARRAATLNGCSQIAVTKWGTEGEKMSRSLLSALRREVA
jgi:hypothetical protein